MKKLMILAAMIFTMFSVSVFAEEEPATFTSDGSMYDDELGSGVYLTDLEPFADTQAATDLPSSYETDNFGNVYTRVLSCNNGYGEYNEVEYYLGGNYGSLTGTFYITKASVNDVGSFESQKPEIRIYGDDVLLYTKKGCSYKDKPEEFLVNTENVEFLKIVFDGAFYNEGFGWKRPVIVMGEPTLWENPGEESSDGSSYAGKQGIRTRLIDLDPFAETKVETRLQGSYAADSYGNTFNYQLACNNGYGGYNEVEYYLGGKYTELTGYFYITKASVDSAGSFDSDLPEIRIYGDDELLYTKKGCSSTDRPEEFQVDMSGVGFLKVVFDGACYTESWGWQRPLIAIGEPVLWSPANQPR